MKVLTWVILILVVVLTYIYLSGTSGYDAAPGTVAPVAPGTAAPGTAAPGAAEPPPPPPTLFDKNHPPPPPTLFDKNHPPPPPTLFDKNHPPPPPTLFSRKSPRSQAKGGSSRPGMGGSWQGVKPQKICIDIT